MGKNLSTRGLIGCCGILENKSAESNTENGGLAWEANILSGPFK